MGLRGNTMNDLEELIEEIEAIIEDAEKGFFSVDGLKDLVEKFKLSLNEEVKD